MEEVLKRISDFANEAHGDQKRKYTGLPYMTHCIKVMETCREYTSDIAILSAALLHDVVEDTALSLQDVKIFLSEEFDNFPAEKTTQLVDDLTDEYVKTKYPDLNRRTRKYKEIQRLYGAHPDAQTVKYADILDNATDMTIHDPDFARVYLRECDKMLEGMREGNEALYERARHVVDQCLASIKQQMKI